MGVVMVRRSTEMLIDPVVFMTMLFGSVMAAFLVTVI